FGSANVLYYRLKQVDFDAVFSYSPVVLVQQDNNLLSNAVVTPNPFTSEITILSNKEYKETISLQLFNLSGKMVAETSIQPADFPEIHWNNLDNLPAGIYVLKTEINNVSSYYKLIKN
ncbi:MAG: T9SS type A sorting domain-containing protein, partial [Bacteroidota bacterium]|nr:T9SS type A sorting domain-containing protein [Bacteroidota bacterium]